MGLLSIFSKTLFCIEKKNQESAFGGNFSRRALRVGRVCKVSEQNPRRRWKKLRQGPPQDFIGALPVKNPY